VADDAFALKPYQMKPYSHKQLIHDKQVYNYRLSRARRVVEQAFGIMSQRFRVLGRPIPLTPAKVELVVMTICCLHNFLLRNTIVANNYITQDQTVTDNNTTTGLASMSKQGSNRYAADAGIIRDKFCQFFNSAEGSVSWQDARVNQM